MIQLTRSPSPYQFTKKNRRGRQVATVSQFAPNESHHLPRPHLHGKPSGQCGMWARRLDGLLYRFSMDRGQPPRPYRIIVGKTLIGRVWSLIPIALQCTIEY